MIITLEETKQFLRVDYTDDDSLILDLMDAAEKLCREITKLDVEKFEAYCVDNPDVIRAAEYYTVSYLYDNRNSPDYRKLKLNLRAMLSGIRERGLMV